MRTTHRALGIMAVLGCGWGLLRADAPKGNAALAKRGEYLVNQVARCGDCHTPRDARGRLDMTRHLQGAPIPFTPKQRGKEWEDKAPNITMSGKAGKWSEDRMINYLMKGDSDPPMPAYRLTRDDAAAVTAYLRSLPGNGAGGKERRKDDDD
jgi:mono/diheme cytochrome c family protein